MKRKQLLALIMAGTIVTGMSPATVAFAEADTQTMTIEDTAAVAVESEEGEAVADTVDTTEDIVVEQPSEDSADQPAEEPAAEPTQEAVETPAAQPAQNTEEAVDDGFGSGSTDELTVEEEEIATQAEEAGTIVIKGAEGEQVFDSLQAAIDSAPANVDVTSQDTITQIYIKGEIELSATVTIGEQRNISIVSADTNGASIKRAAGFTGDMFQVTGGSSFQFGLSMDGEALLNLTVDGSLPDFSEAAGSIIAMDSGYFGMSDGVLLTGNITSAVGSAICNRGGKIGLAGGRITDNQSSAKQGGIYSEGEIRVSGNVVVSGNTDNGTEETENSIVLNTDNAYIMVVGPLSETADLRARRLDPATGKLFVTIGLVNDQPCTTMEEVLKHVSYLDSAAFSVNQNGVLEEIKAEEKTMKLKGDSVKWSTTTDHQVDVKFHATGTSTNGKFYASWIKSSESVPNFDTVKANAGATGAVSADVVSFSLPNVDYDTDIKVVVYAEDNDGLRAEKPLVLALDKKTSPVVTDTPSRETLNPSVSDSKITGLEEALAFYPGKLYSFKVTGAGEDNTSPIKGDTKWVPYGWAMSSKNINTGYQKSWSIGNVNGIKQAKTFKMYVFFQKYTYNGSSWEATSVREYKECEFKSKAIDFTVTPSGTVTPSPADGSGTGGYDGYDGSGDGTGDGTDSGDDAENHDGTDSETGTSSATNARTADNSPIAVMMMLASLSLVAGGYVLVRKRKKEI